jgi:hypothetical protein
VRQTRSGRCFVLTVLLALCPIGVFLITSAANAQLSCGNFAVATALQTAGKPLPDEEVMITSMDGGEIARASFAQATGVTPSTLPGYGIVHSYGREIAVFDVDSQTITPVDLGEEVNGLLEEPFFLSPADSPFMIFGDVTFQDAYLLDVRSGEAVAISTLVEDARTFVSGSIASTGDMLLVSSGFNAYLVPLENPTEVSLADPSVPTRDPAFTADGQAVIYTTGSEISMEIRSQDLVGGQPTDLGTTSELGRLVVLPNDDLLLIHHDGIGLQRAAEGTRREYRGLAGEVSAAFVSPDRHFAAVYAEDGDERIWTLIDLSTSSATPLQESNGRLPGGFPGEQRWLIFPPTEIPGAGVPGATYLSLDLQTGTVSSLLAQDSSEVYQFASAGDSAGRFALVNAVSPGIGRLWLLDAESGTGNLVGQSTGNILGQVAPDGCHLAIGTFDTIGEGRQGSVQIYSLPDMTPGPALPDSILLGWVEL